MPKIKKPTYISIQARPDTTKIRTQEFNGAMHLILPMVILVEGVIHPSNAEHPELALASEFAKYPAGWNGRPVLLNHPKDESGQPISANAPKVVENQHFGQLFNTELRDTKLHSEAWINLDRVKEIGGEAEELITKIQNGKIVAEVSTGLFTTPEEVEGIYNNESFKEIWREVVPDHLAILSEGVIGACSVEDGCGTPRVNAQHIGEGDINMKPKLKTNCACGGSTQIEPTTSEATILQNIMTKLKDMMGFKENREMNHRDISQALLAALALENPNAYYYIVATYNDRFVYYEGYNDMLIQRPYQIGEDDIVSLGADKVSVRPVTDFVPVSVKAEEPKANSSTEGGESVNLEENLMKTREQRVSALIANKASKYDESDRPWLLALEDAQIEKIEASTTVEVDDEAKKVEVAEAEKAAAEQRELAANKGQKPLTAEQYIAQAPSELQEVLQSGLRMQRSHRAKLIDGIVTNSEFKAEELGGYELTVLERMYKAVTKSSFVGLAAGRLDSVIEDQMRVNADTGFADDPEPLVPVKSAA
jgi:hypothetical protein